MPTDDTLAKVRALIECSHPTVWRFRFHAAERCAMCGSICVDGTWALPHLVSDLRLELEKEKAP